MPPSESSLPPSEFALPPSKKASVDPGGFKKRTIQKTAKLTGCLEMMDNSVCDVQSPLSEQRHLNHVTRLRDKSTGSLKTEDCYPLSFILGFIHWKSSFLTSAKEKYVEEGKANRHPSQRFRPEWSKILLSQWESLVWAKGRPFPSSDMFQKWFARKDVYLKRSDAATPKQASQQENSVETPRLANTLADTTSKFGQCEHLPLVRMSRKSRFPVQCQKILAQLLISYSYPCFP